MAGIGAGVVVIAVAVGITLAVAGSSGGSNLVTGGTPQLKHCQRRAWRRTG